MACLCMYIACSVKALIHYYGGRFIFVARINRVTSNGNAPLAIPLVKPFTLGRAYLMANQSSYGDVSKIVHISR